MGTKSNRSSGTQFNPKGLTQGNTLVDPFTGLPIHVITDGSGIRRLAVDANITAQNITVDVNLDSANDEVAVEDPDTGAHIRVEPDGSINVNTNVDADSGDNVAISAHPNQLFDEDADTLTTTAFEEIYTFTSANNGTRLTNIICTAGTPSTFRLKINGTLVRELRSSSLERNVTFKFEEPRPLASGSTISIEAKVERLILASYGTFTALEGYID